MRNILAGLLAATCSIATAQTVSVFNVRTSLIDLAPDDGIDPFISGGGIASLADQVAHPIDMLAPLVPRTISAHTQATITIDWDLTLETVNNQFASAAAHVYSAFWGYPAQGMSPLKFGGVIGASAIFENGAGPYDNMLISKTFSYRDATVQVTNDTDESQVFAWYAAAEFWREIGIPTDPPPIPEPETYAMLLVGLSALALHRRGRINRRNLSVRSILAAFLFAGSAGAAPIAGQGTWETTLQARDIDGDGTADAFYDTDLDVTWLADANYALTTGFWLTTDNLLFKRPGQLAPNEARAWATTLSVKGTSGWRLPTTANWLPDGCGNAEPWVQPGSYCAITPDPTVNELAHLYSVTLGNVTKVKPMNTGDFSNAWLDGWYYSGIYTGPVAHGGVADVVYGWQYGTIGTQIAHMEYVPVYAWLLHDGDIASVPEPETYALMLLGLAAIASRRSWGNHVGRGILR